MAYMYMYGLLYTFRLLYDTQLGTFEARSVSYWAHWTVNNRDIH